MDPATVVLGAFRHFFRDGVCPRLGRPFQCGVVHGSRRTAEFGVRSALGASRIHILWTAVRVTLGSAVVGIMLGATTSLCLQPLLRSWMKSDHPGMAGLAMVAVLLASASVVACLIPAFRAVRIHPVEALRCE